MENLGKIVKILIAGIGVGTLGYLLHREYKKSIIRQVQEDEKLDNELKEAGIDPKRFDNEDLSDVNENMVKALYMSVDTEIDEDIIDIQNCIDNDNVIHLRQFDIEGREKTIDILFEIPESSSERGNFNVPKIADYINAFMKKKNELEEKLNQQIRTGLEGYFVVGYINNDGHPIMGTVKIPKELHLPYAHGKNDGLVAYIDQMRNLDLKNIDIDELSKFVDIQGNTDLQVFDIKLLFKLSINRELTKLSIVKEILKDLVDFEVERQGSYLKTTYEYIMFNAYGPDGTWSLMHYYIHEKSKGVMIEDYYYDDYVKELKKRGLRV